MAVSKASLVPALPWDVVVGHIIPQCDMATKWQLCNVAIVLREHIMSLYGYEMVASSQDTADMWRDYGHELEVDLRDTENKARALEHEQWEEEQARTRRYMAALDGRDLCSQRRHRRYSSIAGYRY